MKLVTVFLLGMLLFGLTACEAYRELGERGRREREAREQLEEIRELYNECLKRKEKDRKVDCSGYQTAIEGKPAK
jgi:hypothetical protein